MFHPTYLCLQREKEALNKWWVHSEVWESSIRSLTTPIAPNCPLHPHSHLLCMLILELSIGALGPCLSCTGVIPAFVLRAALADILTRLCSLAMNLSHLLAIVCSHWAADRSGYSAGRTQSLPVLWLCLASSLSSLMVHLWPGCSVSRRVKYLILILWVCFWELEIYIQVPTSKLVS